MKNIWFNKKKLISILLVGISLCTSSIGEKYVHVNGNKVNVRKKPTTDNKKNIIGKVNNGDTFTYLSHEGNWYLIEYNGQYGYISDSYSYLIDDKIMEIAMAKITGNNINIRSSSNMDNNIIGFADITDSFRIISKENDWYIIDYLGNIGYVNSKFVKEDNINIDDLNIIKMVYLTSDSPFYDENNNYLTTLPMYQYAKVIREENNYYKVNIDGVIGYIEKNNTKTLSNKFIVSDLGRQIVKVFKNNKEVYRAHIISGRKSMQTDLGIYKIGHKVKDYQLTADKFVKYWIEYNGNEGYHDASWQKDKYFMEVAKIAYDKYSSGQLVTYPACHGSHGCNNLKLDDVMNIYNIVNVGDNVLVIRPNNLVKNHIIGSKMSDNMAKQKVKKFDF